jgi:uncharacterized surface protein with fasciclin (FAS1) repeats
MVRILLTAMLIVGLALVAAACGDDDDDNGADGTTATGAAAEGTTATEATAEIGTHLDSLEQGVEQGQPFTTLLKALEVAGLENTFDGEGPITLFAPHDAVFAALPEGQLDALLDDPEALREVLEYHLVADDLSREDIFGLDSITTIQGEPIAVTDDGYTLNGEASFFAVDVPATNGTAHVINGVLIPPGTG